MRKLFLLLSFLAVSTTFLSAQTQNSHHEQAKVNQTLIKFFDGIATLDMELINQCSTHDFLLLEEGEVWNMDTFTKELNKLKTISFSRTNHLDFIQTEINGSSAWVVYNNAADIAVNEQKMSIQWLESAVLMKEGSDWKIRLLHSTIVKPNAE